jgi:hypothetical protein
MVLLLLSIKVLCFRVCQLWCSLKSWKLMVAWNFLFFLVPDRPYVLHVSICPQHSSAVLEICTNLEIVSQNSVTVTKYLR